MAEQERRFTQLVVIGASAGGIEVLSALVASLPVEFPAPIVVAQHLSPSRHSSLADILARRGTLPVRTVNGHEPLDPGTIYVVPPDRDVTITDHEVRVTHEDGAGPRPSVDRLFRSAAEVFREDLIAVILSGTGSDGAAGAREVKQAGGTVVIQNPETASFPGMPLSLSPSIVDIVANPENIGPLLYDLLTGVFTIPPATEDGQFRSFLDQLREESGIDFTTYKQPTIMRRLQRRMVATSQTTLADYIRHLRRHPEERQRLIASFLIKVTEFFRDPELFAHLRERVLPELIAEAQGRGGELRLWSAGCATGEEAYSLAMLVNDLLGDEADRFNVRIFATDLDNEAVAYARHGVYPARALAGLSPAMIERYFTEYQGEYEVKKAIRTCLVFGEHDLGQRAPFPRIDLILCRNVLIYFTAALQRRALQLFAFSLRPGGYLALGKSETIGPLAESFAVDQSRLKVFRRIGDRAFISPTPIREAMPMVPPRPAAPRAGPPAQSRLPRPLRDAGRLRGVHTEQVLLGLPVAVVLVDRDYDVSSINAAARRLFGIHTGAIDRDFIHLVRHFPAAALRRLIDQAAAGEPAPAQIVRAEDDLPEAQRSLEVTAYPLPPAEETGELLVALVAVDVTERERARRLLAAAEEKARRLTAANEEVLEANVELTGTIATLRTENEELLVAGEEVQAATEEVETLNEELQASNEELETLNEELQATVEELNTTNDDLQARTTQLQEMAVVSDAARTHLEAILDSISDAVLVVDGNGAIVLTNPAYARMFGAPDATFQPEDDAGRPRPPEESPLRRAARGETFSLSFTVSEPDGGRRWYEAEGRAVPGEATASLGVVTIRDITERSLRALQDQWLAIASHELRTPLAALTVYLQLARRALPAETAAARPGQHLDRAQEQTQRIAALIDQMIDATRFEFGRIVLTRAPLALEPVVRRAVETAQVLGAGAEIRFAAEAEPTVLGDAARLEQAVLNLLTNAIAHAANADRVDVRLRQAGETAEIEVRDDGPGIPEAELAGIFERFHQGPRTMSGLGLGLYIAREIASGHGGTIDVQSIEGEGTTFTIRLPVLPNAEQPAGDSP